MYLGQLLDGEPALISARAGIKILRVEVQQDPELKGPLAQALCSLSETLLNSQPVSPETLRILYVLLRNNNPIMLLRGMLNCSYDNNKHS